ncbi:MAG: hypothetical protein CTY24_15680, partial [Methylobacter sp.]
RAIGWDKQREILLSSFERAAAASIRFQPADFFGANDSAIQINRSTMQVLPGLHVGPVPEH